MLPLVKTFFTEPYEDCKSLGYVMVKRFFYRNDNEQFHKSTQRGIIVGSNSNFLNYRQEVGAKYACRYFL